MSLNKAIEHGKEHRKPYTGGKAFVRSCRNHGSCSFCLGNRTFKFRDKHPDDEKIVGRRLTNMESTAMMQDEWMELPENLIDIPTKHVKNKGGNS